MKVKFLKNTDYSNTGLDVIKAKTGDIKEIQDAELAKKFCERKWCEPVGKEPEAEEPKAKEEIIISDVEAPAMKTEDQEEDDFLGLIDEKPKKNKRKKKKKDEDQDNKMRSAPENKGG